MNKHIFLTLALIGASASSMAADSQPAPTMTLALYDGSQTELLQPVELDRHTRKAAELRVNDAVDVLNEKLSKQLDAKFTKNLRVTSR